MTSNKGKWHEASGNLIDAARKHVFAYILSITPDILYI